MKNLFSRAKKMDAEAYWQIFEQYEKQIYWIAYIQLKNVEDALDVVQETAYLSYKKLHSLKDDQMYKSWLMRIAYNCAMDVLRKKNKEAILEPEYENYIADIKEYEEDYATTITLKEVMEVLQPMERTAITLRYYEDYKLIEIADIMGLPIGTVKTIIYRSLSKLRKQLEGEQNHVV